MESKLREEIARQVAFVLEDNGFDPLCMSWLDGGYAVADALLPLLNRAKEEGAREMREAAAAKLAAWKDEAARQGMPAARQRWENAETALRALPLPAPQNMGGEQ